MLLRALGFAYYFLGLSVYWPPTIEIIGWPPATESSVLVFLLITIGLVAVFSC